MQGNADIEINDIFYDSREPHPGSVFVAVNGKELDGHDFISKAVENGANAVICNKKNHCAPLIQNGSLKDITVILVEDTLCSLGRMASILFGEPEKHLTTVGITGTKGKTSTSYMIKKLLECSNIKTGLIGTIVVDTGDGIIESCNTTPSSYLLEKYMEEMVKNGCKVAVMEVSSQGLMMKRVNHLRLDYGIFTNIKPDHISRNEHRDFEEYMHWKSMLFRQCNYGILNGDDPKVENILRGHTCITETYGFGTGNNLTGENFKQTENIEKPGITFDIKGVYNIKLSINTPGIFTAYNGMAAALLGSHFGIREESIISALKEIHIPGRQEVISLKNGAVAVIDYAHNGESLRELLTCLNAYPHKRIVCIFGCGGNRNRQRRFDMGHVAAQLGDFSIITSDNPRNESPSSIISDIIVGMNLPQTDYMIIPNRKNAIIYGIKNSKAGDIIVVAGKGHETYQIIGDKKIHFDDKQVIISLIEKVEDGENYYTGNS